MKITTTPLDGLLVIEPKVFKDERGLFLETFQSSRYKAAGIKDDFNQDNQSRSSQGVLRGLHFQIKHPQAQIITVLRGCIFDVAVDLRTMSPTYGNWFGVELSDTGPRQMYMPPGFAHGFCVISELADLHYKVSGEYDPTDEGGLIWNDSEVGIKWPKIKKIISAKDLKFLGLKDIKSK
jgi:dTDP-4-dehydrorhamnose 3,5-epimerase